MKVHIKGQGDLTLSKADFVGGGGEGDVYAQGSTAIKVYHDPAKMIPVGKITELASLTDPDIIKPERIVLNGRGTPIGYTMRFLPGTLALCQLFPPVFRTRNNISPQQTLDLVRSLQDRVTHTHQAGILVVDLNEMNYVVDPVFSTVYAIDVDSYQTPHYPATAIMPGIRDPKVQGLDFTQLSDWFSFAIVSFNLFVGIHPYKGTHPSIHGLEERMLAGISVFNPDVSVPRVVLPFDTIPDVYRQWYRAVLEEGKRLPPPSDLYGVIVITPTVKHLAGTVLDIEDLYAYPEAVLGFWDHAGATLTWTTDGLYIGQRRVHGAVKGLAGLGFSPRQGHPVVAGTSGGKLRLLNVSTGKEIPVDLRADAVMAYQGTVYVRSRATLLEVVLNDLGDKLVASTRPAASCLEHATKLFQGVAIQDLLGATWAALFPVPGKTYQMHLPELDPYRVVDARFDGNILMVVGHQKGKYDRLVFRFDEQFATYDLRTVTDVTPTGLNFVVLDSGTCVCLDEQARLELSSTRKGSTQVKVVEDASLGADMTLVSVGGRVGFIRGERISKMRMK